MVLTIPQLWKENKTNKQNRGKELFVNVFNDMFPPITQLWMVNSPGHMVVYWTTDQQVVRSRPWSVLVLGTPLTHLVIASDSPQLSLGTFHTKWPKTVSKFLFFPISVRTCPPIPAIEGLWTLSKASTAGTIREYNADPGYHFHDGSTSRTIECLPDGRWSVKVHVLARK